MLRILRILVVEDERGVRLLLKRVLEDAGTAVTAVATVQEALAEIEREAPDVILSDIRMPGSDGYELIRRVRARDKDRGGHTPAIAISGSVDEQDIPAILAAGFQRFIRKPFSAAEVRDAIVDVTGWQGA